MGEFHTRNMSRRSLLCRVAGGGAAAVVLGVATATPATAATVQAGYRYCGKCAGLFWPLGNKGCPAAGPHLAMGWTFQLPIDSYWLPAQLEWRVCKNCNSLHFDGYPDPDGRCSAGGEHQRTGIDPNIALPANVGEPPWHQANWRFCGNCFMLFFDGYPTFKGTCPFGGGHWAIGWNFAVPVYSYNT